MNGRHEFPDPPQTPTNPTRVIEVKVVATTVVALLASVAYAVLNAVAAHPDVLSDWSPALRFATIAALPPLLTFLAGWAVPSNRI